jgi:phage tail sheath protein FI
VIFQGGTTLGNSNYGTAVTTIVDERSSGDQPVIGIVYARSTTSAIDTNVTGVTFTSGANNYNYVKVYGEKIHLDTTGAYSIETPLAADVAGCIARTDRDFYPWFSPAGSRRGRILNVLRLKRSLTTAEQDNLYANRINPVVTFPGDGTLLYGDKTAESTTTTLSRINVSRLFMYIKKSLAPVARSILFEQNDAITRSRFKIAAEGFLDRIVGQRGITEYRVICDSTNNTPEVVEANYFVADILIKPIPSINYVKITLTNKDLSEPIG